MKRVYVGRAKILNILGIEEFPLGFLETDDVTFGFSDFTFDCISFSI